MEKFKVVVGILLGFFCSAIGVLLFLEIFTDHSFFEGIAVMRSTNSLGKLITLGCILDLCAFFLMIKLKQDLMARGIVLAAFLIAILTIFV